MAFFRAARAASFALAVAGMAGPAQAQTWRQSSANEDRTGYIDTASMTRTGNRVRFVREVRTEQPQSFSNGTRFDRLGAVMEADCTGRTMRTIELYAKLGDQEIARGPDEGNAVAFQQGTTAEADFNAVCFNRWPD